MGEYIKLYDKFKVCYVLENMVEKEFNTLQEAYKRAVEIAIERDIVTEVLGHYADEGESFWSYFGLIDISP
jgi:hypothetical protein